MGLDINLNTSKIDISEEDGLNVDLYNDNIDISDDEADDIIIEITGLKSLNKFIGLEDTPLYYDNGKFLKIEDNKIVYADIQWKDISGDISESPEIVAVISDLVNEVASDIIDERINLHNLNTEAHPFIQNIIQENYNTLNTKIDDTKEELSEALNTEITNRETADNELSESIQQETLARIEADTTLQNNIDTLTNNLNTEIENRTNADNLLRDDIDSISGELAQEIIDRQTQDNLLQEQITSNYNTLDNKIDIEISDRISADDTLQNNIDTEALARQSADTTLQNNINELTQIIKDNNTAVNNRIDETNDTVSDLSNTVTSNYNILDGKIDTEISNRTSADTTLQNNIDAEASTRQSADVTLQGKIDTLSDTVSSNYNNLSNQIDNLSDTVSDNYTDLDGKISDLIDKVNDNDTAINNKVDGINTTLTTSINNLSNTVSNNYTTLDTKIDNTKTSLEGNISDLSNTVNQNYTDLSNAITTSSSTINSRIDSEVLTLNTAIGTEVTSRQNADNNLQSQIDAIVSSSDVFDIVGTYAELQAYDISTVPVNDIIKVLVDSSHDNAATYYRCIETEGIKSWIYIGSEGAYYTKSESDTKFVAKTTTINDKPLSSNITLTASDVNALPNTTVIGDGVLTLQKNGVNIGTFNANATANKSINITTPTQANDIGAMPDTTTIEDLTTTAQLNALNSGATTENINQITINANNIVNLQTNKQDVLTAGENIQINNNVISATDTKYTAGTGISIENGIISNTQTSAEWGNIQGTLSNQTDLQTELNRKQNNLISSENIKTINLTSILGSGDISVATSAQGALADTALQPNDNISDLINDANYITSEDLPIVNNGVLTIQVNGDDLAIFSANQSGNTTANIIVPDSATWGSITGTLSDQTDLQQALDGKQPTIIGAATTITDNDLTAGRVLISDNSGKVATSSISTIKLGYLSDVTSNIQVQLNGKYDSSNPAGYISSASVDTLTDVTLTNVTDGEVLKYNSTTQKWENATASSATSLDTLTDVEITSPTQGQNLTYDAVNNKWINTTTTATIGWGGITGNINDQTDLKNALDSKASVTIRDWSAS